VGDTAEAQAALQAVLALAEHAEAGSFLRKAADLAWEYRVA
jgi:hypothetical protein